MSAIDNLIKGGAGQAVQNLNYYFGYNAKKVSLYVKKQLFLYLSTSLNLMKLQTTKNTQKILKKTYQYLKNVKLIIYIYQQRNKYIHLATIKILKLVPLIKNYAESLDLGTLNQWLM